MAAQHFPDGIKIGPDSTGNERLALYSFDEFITDSIDLGTMAPNEVKTIVVSNVPTVRYGDTVIARPLNPQDNFTLLVKFAWTSNENEVSIMLKNDINANVTYNMQSQWALTYFSTATPQES